MQNLEPRTFITIIRQGGYGIGNLRTSSGGIELKADQRLLPSEIDVTCFLLFESSGGDAANRTAGDTVLSKIENRENR